MKNKDQMKQEFRTRVRSRRDGFEPLQARIQSEIHAARRRNRFVLISRPLRAAAALLIVSTGILFTWKQLSGNKTLPLCPHSASVEASPLEPVFITQLRELNKNRICHCSPRYSGSLRKAQQID
jgi:hypothetical protein